MSPLAPSPHCICWWPNTLTPKATHRKPTTWDGRRDQLWLRLTSREHPSWGRLSPGRLMEAYFTSCNSVVVPIARLEVMPSLSSPSAPCTLGVYSRFFCVSSTVEAANLVLTSLTWTDREDRMFFKHSFTTACPPPTHKWLFFRAWILLQITTWTGKMSLTLLSLSLCLWVSLFDNTTDSWECWKKQHKLSYIHSCKTKVLTVSLGQVPGFNPTLAN